MSLFQPGCHVQHAEHGLGTVHTIELTPYGGEVRRLFVDFDVPLAGVRMVRRRHVRPDQVEPVEAARP